MILGFFVRSSSPTSGRGDREFYSETSSSAYEQRNSTGSRTPLLNNDELNPSLRFHDCETLSRSLSRGASMALDMLPNVYGKKL